MRRVRIFSLETPYREPLVIEGFEFGDEAAEKSVAVVGSMRGNEIEQTFVCAELVSRLADFEARGLTDPARKILVVPAVNAFSMNISRRFWPVDNTDINRMFPGYDLGETTQRIAAGFFSAVRGYEYGIQLCSFYLPGDFEPHVRVARANFLADSSLELAEAFGLPYVIEKEPGSFDTTTLNYNWQVWNTHAFSLYVRDMASLDTASAAAMEDAILRFLDSVGATRSGETGGFRSVHLNEGSLVDVRTTQAGGFFLPRVEPGRRVRGGDLLGEVTDTLDAHVRESLVSPVDGRVFFSHRSPLINQHTVAFKLAPDA